MPKKTVQGFVKTDTPKKYRDEANKILRMPNVPPRTAAALHFKNLVFAAQTEEDAYYWKLVLIGFLYGKQLMEPRKDRAVSVPVMENQSEDPKISDMMESFLRGAKWNSPQKQESEAVEE